MELSIRTHEINKENMMEPTLGKTGFINVVTSTCSINNCRRNLCGPFRLINTGYFPQEP